MARSYNQVQATVPAETAFSFVSDLSHAAQWDPQVERVEVITPGPIGVGTRWLMIAAMGGGIRLHLPYELLAYEPHERIVLSGRTSYLSYTEEVRFAPADGGCTVTWQAEAKLHSFLWPGNPIFHFVYQKIADKAVSGIARALAGQAGG